METTQQIDKLPYYDFKIESFVELSRFEQRRKHKRPRINKKWRKRYGFISERFQIPFSQYEAKHFKKYQKQFVIDGRANPKRPAIQYAIAPSMPVYMVEDYASPKAVSIKTETIELKRIGVRLATSYQYDLSEVATRAKEMLIKAVKES